MNRAARLLSHDLSRGAALILAAASWSLADPPSVTYLEPAGAQQGQTLDVAAAGKFDNWPVKVWVDHPALTVEPLADKGKLKITVAPDAPPGIRWVRLYDAHGAAGLRPFVVGAIAELTETEPNYDPPALVPLTGPTVVNGKLAKSGDVDAYAVDVTQGQTLVASMLANELLGSPMDGVIQICDAKGFVLMQVDEGRGLDPLAAFTAPADGRYIVRVFAFPAEPDSGIRFSGGDAYLYRLTITTGPFIDHAAPLAVSHESPTDVVLHGWNWPTPVTVTIPQSDGEADDTVTVTTPDAANLLRLSRVRHPLLIADDDATPDKPQPIDWPAVVTGRIHSPRQAQAFRFNVKKDDKLWVRLESRSLGYDLDALLRLTDAAGKQLARVDDINKHPDPELTHTAAEDGELRLIVTDLFDHAGPRHAYRLTLERASPDYLLTLGSDSVVVAADKPLEIPVNVRRRHGFDQPVTITAVDLPQGVTVEPATSEPKGDSAKQVKLKLTAAADAPPFSGIIRITGQSGDIARTAFFDIGNGAMADTRLWLTVVGK